MRKLLTNLALLLLTFSTLFAQTDFRKGYIIKLNNDTLHGYVNFQKASLNSIACNFKRFETALPVTYSPSKLKGYGIDGGKQFVSVVYDGKPIYAEYLVIGKASLLYLASGKFLFINGNSLLTELKSGKTIDKSQNKEYSNYKDFLKEVFNLQELNKEIDNSKFEINSLVNVFKLFNELSRSPYYIPERSKEKSFINDYSLLGSNKFQFGILGGVGTVLFSVKTDNANCFYLSNADYSCNVYPVAGFFLKGGFSKRAPRLSYQADFLFQKVSIYGFTKNSSKDYISTCDDIFIKYSSLNSILKLKYTISKSNLKFQPHVGVAFFYRLSSDYLRYHQEYYPSLYTVKTYEYKNVRLPNLGVGLNGGITLEYQLSSARSLMLNLDYIYENKVIKKPDNTYTSNTKIRFNSIGSGILITMGLTL